MPLRVPEGCPQPKFIANGTQIAGGAVLKVNLVTSVVGYVMIELQDAAEREREREREREILHWG